MPSTPAPTFSVSKTILGVERELQIFTGVSPVFDTLSTLNALYNTFPSLTPINGQTVKYFGIGINGFTNVNDSNLAQVNQVSMTDMNLYTQIPFRCVPVEQDLDPSTRALYRMRIRKTISGSDYFLYYLKMITFNDSQVKLTQTDPVTGLETPYTLNYSNLTPTVPTPSVNGVITDTSSEINTTVSCTLNVSGAEVTEVINVLYNGDLRYARISELGLYSGEDQTVTGLTGSATPLTYTEAIYAQLALHYTYFGDDLSTPSATEAFNLRLGSGDSIFL